MSNCKKHNFYSQWETCPKCAPGLTILKVGDVVDWNGIEGVVYGLSDDSEYPIYVSFKNGDVHLFTVSGKFYVEQTSPVLKLIKREA